MNIFGRDYVFTERINAVRRAESLAEQRNAVRRAESFANENDEFVAFGAIICPWDFINWIASLSWWIKIPIYMISFAPVVYICLS